VSFQLTPPGHGWRQVKHETGAPEPNSADPMACPKYPRFGSCPKPIRRLRRRRPASPCSFLRWRSHTSGANRRASQNHPQISQMTQTPEVNHGWTRKTGTVPRVLSLGTHPRRVPRDAPWTCPLPGIASVFRSSQPIPTMSVRCGRIAASTSASTLTSPLASTSTSAF